MKLVLLFVVGFLAGCATATSIVGPDGTENFLVKCGGVEQCYEKAREVCHGNYKIVNTTDQVYGDAKFTSSQTNLLIKCDK